MIPTANEIELNRLINRWYRACWHEQVCWRAGRAEAARRAKTRREKLAAEINRLRGEGVNQWN